MTRPTPWLTSLAIGLLLIACGGPNDGHGATPALEGIVTGTLTDATGTPLAGQQLTLARAPLHVTTAGDLHTAASGPQVATTDAQGRFAFDVDEAGDYTLTNLADTTGALARVSVVRQGDGSLASAGAIELTATALGAVTGSVAGHGAGVLAYLAGTSFVALTDDGGDFVIGRVPAGAYQARASIAAVSSPPVAVTVASGSTATLTEALRIGPVITGLTPDGFVPPKFDRTAGAILVSPTAFILTGSGFGDRRGVSRLSYGGGDVPSAAILQWSDTSVTVDILGLDGPWVPAGMVERETLRFELATVAGAAISDVSGVYGVDASPAGGYLFDGGLALDPIDVWVGFQTLAGISVAGMQLGVSARNAGVFDIAGDPVTVTTSQPESTWDATEPGYAFRPASLRLAPMGWLPVILTLDPTVDALVAEGEPVDVVIRGASFEFSAGPGEGDAVVLSGIVRTPNGDAPMPDDGRFSVRVTENDGWGCNPSPTGAEPPVILEAAIFLDSDGAWSVSLSTTEDLVCAAVVYDGVPLDLFSVSLSPDSVSLWPSDLVLDGSYVLVDD